MLQVIWLKNALDFLGKKYGDKALSFNYRKLFKTLSHLVYCIFNNVESLATGFKFLTFFFYPRLLK